MMVVLFSLVRVFLLTLLPTGDPAHAANQYFIKDIGVIGSGATVEGMNDRGQMVGTMPAGLGGTAFQSWWYDGDRMIRLHTCGGLTCRAMAINARAQMAGNVGRNAFIYSHSRFLNIGGYARAPSVALAINDMAEAVGWYTLIPVRGEHFSPERHAFLYRGRQMVDLGTLGGMESVATSINNAGQVAGYAKTYGGESHAFLFTGDRMMDLGTLGGPTSRANSLNDLGQVVGSAGIAGGKTSHAFLYTGGTMIDLGALDGGESTALSINRSGQIVGTSGSRGWLWANGKMTDLLTLIPPASGWTSLIPRCINNRGQIAGVGLMTDGQLHVFLMSAISP